ncbi:MAG: TonB-dependent receptor, partial [Acidobacteria bacterium]|nr:TonB-dependent receptor [Acidobacteriota bacterium]
VGSFFHRNEAFDAVNSLDETLTDAPHLRRFNYSLAGGGPIWKDKIFFFGSSERITEDRVIDFNYPDLGTTPGGIQVDRLLRAQEAPFENPTRSREIRNFLKLNEQFGRHSLVQEVNYTNGYVRDAGAAGVPSTRNNTSARRLLLAFGDTILLGDRTDPFIVTLRGAYRDEPSATGPAHPEVGAFTRANLFTRQNCPAPCNAIFGDLPQVFFGNSVTASFLNQKYTSFSATGNKLFGDHDVKFGWNFLRTKVDGLDSRFVGSQLFATVDDFATFGAVNSGIFLLAETGGNTPEDDEIHLQNNYNALYVQDDWKLLNNLTVNLGLRYDHDSEFEAKKNFSPRLGVAWAVTPKTVVRAHFGKFYDQFRLGLVQKIPGFGGSDQRVLQSLYFPRGFYGSPSFISSVAFLLLGPAAGPCISNNLTDAQITAAGLSCPFAPPGAFPLVGVDRLNRVVAPGRAPVPANTVINISNVQALTGLTPQQYADQASAAIGRPAGYFNFGAFGVLNNPLIPPQVLATTIDSTFKTPHTLSFSVGVQREITKDMVVEVDYFHREMRNLLGIRSSNLGFRSRVAGLQRQFDPPGTGATAISTYGPFYRGKYDALIVNFNKRFSNRYLLGANYTFAKATDNSLGIFAFPSDSFIGTVPVVTEPCPTTAPCTQQTNANASFTSRNGNFVPQAGTFYNGPDLDKGPSDLALDHIFQVNGLVDLPWRIQVSGIFRVQSGFH